MGVPIKLVHEAEGHVVTVELKNGETYRGLLSEAEETMNCVLKEGTDRITRNKLLPRTPSRLCGSHYFLCLRIY